MIEGLLRLAQTRVRRAVLLAIALAIASSVAGVLLLGLAGWFLTGAALAGLAGPLAAQAFNYLLPSAGVRALAILRTGGRYGERLLSHRAALEAIAHLRPALFTTLARQPPAASLSRAPGEVAAQFGAEVDAFEDQIVRRVSGPAAMAGALVAIAAAWCASWQAALVLLGGLVLLRLIGLVMARRRLPQLHREQVDALAALKSAYADLSPCSVEIAVYGLEERVAAELTDLGDRVDLARRALVREEALVLVALGLTGTITIALLLVFAGGGAPMIALAALAAAGAIDGWGALVRSDMQRQRIGAVRERLDAMLAGAQPEPLAPASGAAKASLTITHDGVSMTLAPGERLLIAGPSGAGKSRLLGTLAGLRTDAPQRLLIDGVEVRRLPSGQTRRLFAYAPQDGALIAGTIADNLRMARPGVDAQAMWQALDAACIGDFVRGAPDGLDHWLSGDNAAISGGQRKRIALARALLAEREWLVLDEPTEGLDPVTEAAVVENLERYLVRTKCGLILVSHRSAPRRLAQRQIDLTRLNP